MSDAVLMINATIGRDAAKDVEGLEAKVRASMRAVLAGNWMELSDDNLMRAGIAGALLDVGTDSEDGRKLTKSIDALKKISAMLAALQAGISVDVASAMPEEGDEILPLVKWWQEEKEAA